MYRFTIRDVLWLLLVLGLGMAWWRDHRRLGIATKDLNQAASAHYSKLLELSQLQMELERRAQDAEISP